MVVDLVAKEVDRGACQSKGDERKPRRKSRGDAPEKEKDSESPGELVYADEPP